MEEWRVLDEGDLFEERYRIKSVLGVGGFAHVYRAIQEDLGREVALKVLRPATQKPGEDVDEEALRTWIERFRREAKVISQMNDPHTITMYDFGHAAAGMSYMVFEYVSGTSLDVVLKQEGTLAPRRVATILNQALQSIHEAHSLGILHRDLKPANILIYEHMGRADKVKVLDFGIAKPMLEDSAMTSADLTQEGSLLGTPRYMAPEQLKGQGVGPHSDIYSLGLVGYELLSGNKAVPGDTTMTVLSQALSPDPIVLPDELEVPEGLRSIIQCMLEKDVEARFSTADEVVRALERWDTENPVVETEPTIALDASDIEEVSGEVSTIRSSEDTSSVKPGGNSGVSRAALVAATLAASLVLILGLLFLAPWEQDDHDNDDEVAIDQLAQSDHDDRANSEPAVQGDTDDEPPLLMEIRATDDEAQISINDEPAGSSPISVDTADIEFPAYIVARSDNGNTAEITIEEPTDEVELAVEDEEAEPTDMPSPEPEPEAQPAPEPRPQPRPEPRPQPQPEPQPQPIAEPDPEPAGQAASDEADDDEPDEPESGRGVDPFIPLD